MSVILNMDLFVDTRYEEVARIFQLCIDQIQKGKGMERHGTQEKFTNQVTWKIITECKGFAKGQMLKKALESCRFNDIDAEIKEMIGAVNYGIFEIMRLIELKGEDGKKLLNDTRDQYIESLKQL